MTFAEQLRPYVDLYGVGGVARILDRNRRTVHQWLAGRKPDIIIRTGVLVVLGRAGEKPVTDTEPVG